jgi:hypothetical protein
MKAQSTAKPEQSRHQDSRDRGGQGQGQGQQAMAVLDSRPEMAQQQDLLSLMAGSPRLQRKCACGAPSAAGGSCAACEEKASGASSPMLQKKMMLGASDDPLEREADRVADQVMAGPLQASVGVAPTHIQRLTGNLGGQTATAPASFEKVLADSGRPLEPAMRQMMEHRFGSDFGDVRVHRSREAEQVARSLDAKAFTVKNHIVFGGVQGSPGSREEQHLLAHELTHVIQQTGLSARYPIVGRERHGLLQRQSAPSEVQSNPGTQQRLCGPDITSSLTTMLGTVEPWFRGLTGFQQSRSCMALGPAGFVVGVNPVMAWDTRELFLPNTSWLDAYFLRSSCGSPRDAGCDSDPTRHLCETSGSCGNSVVVGGRCLLAGTANYSLFGKMCRLCHDYTGRWGRWDMRAIIGAYKTVDRDDSTPPKEVASAAYDGTFPTLPPAAENRGTCTGRCGLTHGGAFNFIWEPYKPR